MIILIGGEKGGTGKTTLATNLATLHANAGHDVLLIDTDKQMSACDWAGFRDEDEIQPRVACIPLYEPNLKKQIPDLADRYEDIIIDAGGRDNAELRRSLAIADVAYFPLQPSQFDMLTVRRVDRLVAEMKTVNDNLKTFIIFNRASPHPQASDHVEAKELVESFPQFNLVKTFICDRKDFQKAVAEGKAITEYRPRNDKAIEEITSLYNEIFNHD